MEVWSLHRRLLQQVRRREDAVWAKREADQVDRWTSDQQLRLRIAEVAEAAAARASWFPVNRDRKWAYPETRGRAPWQCPPQAEKNRAWAVRAEAAVLAAVLAQEADFQEKVPAPAKKELGTDRILRHAVDSHPIPGLAGRAGARMAAQQCPE